MFLVKLDPRKIVGDVAFVGPAIYSTYVGPGQLQSLAVDSAGAAYLAASTPQSAWDISASVVQPACSLLAGWNGTCGLVAKISPGGDKLLYATYLGGAGGGPENGGGPEGAVLLAGIAVDNSGNAVVTGTTYGTISTTPNAWQSEPPRPHQASYFVAKLTVDATGFGYQTYLNIPLPPQTISLDAAGNAYIGSGQPQPTTYCLFGCVPWPDYPAPNGFQVGPESDICMPRSPSGGIAGGPQTCANAGFLAVLNPGGTDLAWASYMGSGSVNAIAVDPSGDVFVSGYNASLAASRIGTGPGASVSLVKISPATSPLRLSSASITEATAFQPGLPALGGLGSIFTTGLDLPDSITAGSYRPPLEMAGVSIYVGQIAAPLLSIAKVPGGGQQINFQVPFESTSNLLEVRYRGVSTYVWPSTAPPAIVAIQHATDYSFITAENPAVRGEDIVVWATGLGPAAEPVATGKPVSVAVPLPKQSFVQSTVGAVTYAGIAAGSIGLYQVNIRVSKNLPPGNQDLRLTASLGGLGVASNIVALPVQ
jgi:uncharacterized protein (TIGR03437 family)